MYRVTLVLRNPVDQIQRDVDGARDAVTPERIDVLI